LSIVLFSETEEMACARGGESCHKFVTVDPKKFLN
jgi:hypothetical protein